jgi:SIT family siderophore-iron:H+ symporter-like MFS transporter
MGVLQGVIGAAGQPVAAKISDVVGRVEMLIAALVFYCVGTIVEASSKSIGAYAGGVVIYQIGFTMYTIIIQVIVTDLSSLQGRLFASFIPPLGSSIPGSVETFSLVSCLPILLPTCGDGVWACSPSLLLVRDPICSIVVH